MIEVLTDAFFSWNAVDLSDHVKSVTIDYSAELLDDTVMGDDTRSRMGGLKDWSVSVEFFQDEDAAKVAQTFFADIGVARVLIIRPKKASAVSSTNPNYTGTGILESMPLVSGEVGAISMTTVEIKAAGTLSRATS